MLSKASAYCSINCYNDVKNVSIFLREGAKNILKFLAPPPPIQGEKKRIYPPPPNMRNNPKKYPNLGSIFSLLCKNCFKNVLINSKKV